MGAVLLLLFVAVVTANLVFTVLVWKERRLSASKIVVPRGAGEGAVSSMPQEVDVSKLVSGVVEAMQRDAEESGEEEVQVSEEDIQKAMKALQGMKL